jgi:hypothetical protein
VAQVCALEDASPEDALLPALATGEPPAALSIFTTQLLTDVHPHALRAVLVGAVCVGGRADPRSASDTKRDRAWCVARAMNHCRTPIPMALCVAAQAHPWATSVHLFCSVSEHAHACQASTELGVEAYREYSQHLQQLVRQAWAAAPDAATADGGPAVSVRVTFLPLLACCLDAGLFVLPSCSSAARRAV